MKQQITDLADVRPGDWAKVEFDGHPAEGEAWQDHTGALCLLGQSLRWPDYTPSSLTFISAEREVALPTEAPAVIVNAVIRGERVPYAVLADIDRGAWVTPVLACGWRWHSPEHITEWELGEVVEADR